MSNFEKARAIWGQSVSKVVRMTFPWSVCEIYPPRRCQQFRNISRWCIETVALISWKLVWCKLMIERLTAEIINSKDRTRSPLCTSDWNKNFDLRNSCTNWIIRYNYKATGLLSSSVHTSLYKHCGGGRRKGEHVVTLRRLMWWGEREGEGSERGSEDEREGGREEGGERERERERKRDSERERDRERDRTI